MNPPAVARTIDLDAAGKQIGRLQYPKISNTAGWAYEFVPIATFANGDGPTVLVSAATTATSTRARSPRCGSSTSCSPSRCTAG